MFIFYDTETSGLSKEFGQILQIALVFTDDNLNILSSKKVECRRSPWIIPSPGALLTTGFTPDDLKKSKNSHYQMMREVDEWVRSQYMPVIFSGYNTLGYDEGILAQNLYQNLRDPGLTQIKNPVNRETNGRSDILTLVRAAYMYMPGALNLTELNGYGSPALSLGSVARQNGVSLSEEDAHDAMNDIRATLAVARVVQKAAPALWTHLTSLATRQGVEDFTAANDVFTHAYLAQGKTRAAVVTDVSLAQNDRGILFNLAIDPAKYLAMSVDELAACLDPKKAKNHPFRIINKAEQPILMPMDQSDIVIPASYDETVAAARAAALKADTGFAARLAEAFEKARPATPAPVDVNLPEKLIDLPVSPAARAKLNDWLDDFNKAQSWAESAALLGDFYTRLRDEVDQDPSLRRFVKLAGRIVYENAPQELSEAKQEKMKRYIAKRILDPNTDVPYMTIAKARKELESIETARAEGDARWQGVADTQIRSLKLYYTAIEKEYAPYAPAEYSRPSPVNDNGAETPFKNAANDGRDPKGPAVP